MCNADVISQTLLLVSVRVGLGLDESGVDALGSGDFLEVDSNDRLTAAVAITCNPRSSETLVYYKKSFLLQHIHFSTTNIF